MVVILQRRVPTTTIVLIALTVAVTGGAAIDARNGGDLFRALLLRPEAVWRGEVWRLVTWPFLHGHPLALVFTCVTLFVFGPDLHVRWGRARYLRYLAGVVLIAGLGTSLVSLVLPGVAWEPYVAGMVVMNTIVIAWARQFPDAPVSVYAILVLSGPAVVQFTVGLTLLFALLFGVVWALPELLAIAAALAFMDRPGRRLLLRLRQLLVRRRLRVVSPGRGRW